MPAAHLPLQASEGSAQWPPEPKTELIPTPPPRISSALPSGPDTIEWPLPTAPFIPEGVHTRDITVAPFSDGQ